MIAQPQNAYFQNQWEKNVSAAEEYIVRSGKPDIVVVGSSLSARLDPEALGPRIENLSLAGGSAVTGLEIIRRCSNVPKMVLVEANVLRDLDTAFLKDRFSELTVWAKRWLPSARVRNQPVNLLLGALNGTPEPETHITEPRVFAALLADQLRDHAQSRDPASVEKAIAQLSGVTSALEARGVKAVFFRMPMDPALEASPKAMDIEARMRRAFPAPRYEWLEVPQGDYLTGDGLHLEPQSARDYSVRLRAAAGAGGL